MDVLSLRYFIAVVEYGNFTKAAERLYVTQPTISRQVSELEKELGVPLLLRGKKNVSLTAAGKIVLEEGREIVLQCNRLMERAKQADGSLSGSLSIGYHGKQDEELLADDYRNFLKKYPHVELHLRRDNLGSLTTELMNGNLDIIYTIQAGLEKMSGISYVKLVDNELVLAIPEDHPFAGKEHIRIKELEGEKFCFLERPASALSIDAIINMCRKNGFSPYIVESARDIYSVVMAVSMGKGIAFVSERMIPAMPEKGVTYIRLDEEEKPDYSIVAAYRTQNKNPALYLYLDEMNILP